MLFPIDKLACCRHRSLPMLTYNLITCIGSSPNYVYIFSILIWTIKTKAVFFKIIIIYKFYVVSDTSCGFFFFKKVKSVKYAREPPSSHAPRRLVVTRRDLNLRQGSGMQVVYQIKTRTRSYIKTANLSKGEIRAGLASVLAFLWSMGLKYRYLRFVIRLIVSLN